jgi:hypothetical protein
MTSGRINLLIAGPGTDPSMLELAPSLNVPIFLSPSSKSPGEMVQQVQTLPSDFTPAASLVEEGQVAATARELEESFRKETSAKIAMLGGSDHPYHSLGWIPTEAALALRGQGYGVAGWGDAALWMIKKGLASPKSEPPVHILDEKQGPLGAAKALAAAGRLKDLRGVCFTGMKSCQDLALALGLACLGIRVGTAIPLPLWGSEKVRILLQEKLAAQGGSLTHFDHPAQAEEILEWFLK